MEPVVIPNPKGFSSTRLRSDLVLLITAIAWGTGFAAQRIAAIHIGVFLFNGTRFLIGALVLLIILRFRMQIKRQDIPWILLAGSLLFIAGALQQAGLITTTAANAGFITGLYTILVPLVLWVGWRKPAGLRIWLAALIAAAGNLLLSLGGYSKPAIGDILELAGALMWAFHIIVITRQANRMDPLQFNISQLFIAGLFNLLMSLVFEGGSTFTSLGSIGWVVLYSGLVPVGIGFTLQIVGQKHAPPADAALILSLEAVFGALSGLIYLGETLSHMQITGCGMIFLAILLSQYAVLRR